MTTRTKQGALVKGHINWYISAKGSGMTMLTMQRLLQLVMSNPGQTVYVNFDLPPGQKKLIEKYATVEKITLPRKGSAK